MKRKYYFKTGINKEIKMWNIELPCATENHEVYIAGRGYVKVILRAFFQ